MEKGLVFLLIMSLLIILSISNVNAIIISEVESNPDGTDSKNEWIELYSEEPVNAEYILVNNDAGEVYDNEDSNQIKVKFNFQGYYVYIFGTQWLDNSDEKVYLYDSTGSHILDSTNIFDDGEDSDFTWQMCNETWIFKEQTREAENCIIEAPEEPETNETENNSTNNETQTSEEGENETSEEINEEETTLEEENGNEYNYQEYPIKEEETQEETPITGSIIKLDSKDIKSSKSTKEIDRNNFATIALGFVVILLLFLIVSQRYKYNKKNEFRE